MRQHSSHYATTQAVKLSEKSLPAYSAANCLSPSEKKQLTPPPVPLFRFVPIRYFMEQPKPFRSFRCVYIHRNSGTRGVGWKSGGIADSPDAFDQPSVID